jgi:hypothetical protein
MPAIPQPVTDDSIQVRQVSQFTWVADEAGRHVHASARPRPGCVGGRPGLSSDDADSLQDLLVARTRSTTTRAARAGSGTGSRNKTDWTRLIVRSGASQHAPSLI